MMKVIGKKISELPETTHPKEGDVLVTSSPKYLLSGLSDRDKVSYNEELWVGHQVLNISRDIISYNPVRTRYKIALLANNRYSYMPVFLYLSGKPKIRVSFNRKQLDNHAD